MPLIDRTFANKTALIGAYSGTDNKRLHYRSWTSATVDGPVLVYVHGIEGHSLWFDRAAVQLSKQGINVYAADRRGTGLNRSSRTAADHTILLSDLDLFLQTVQDQHPNSSLYLLGNCWGGTLSILYAKQEEYTPISGLILSCPAIKTICDVDLPTKLSIAWSYVTNSRKKFDFPLTPEMFTANPEYLEFINNDELRTTSASAGFLVETLKMQFQARQSASKLSLPILLLQAGNDDIVDSETVSKWFGQLKSQNKRYFFFETSCHSLDFEPDISEFLEIITSWVQDRR